MYRAGAKLLTVRHSREFPEAKTTNYLTWLRHHPLIDREGGHSSGKTIRGREALDALAAAGALVTVRGFAYSPPRASTSATVRISPV